MKQEQAQASRGRRARAGSIALKALLALCVAAAVAAMALPRLTTPSAGPTPYEVLIHDGEGKTHTLDAAVDTTLTVETSLGANVIAVEDGRVYVLEANCPGGDCKRQQAISAPGQQLICLPHRLWVELVPQGQAGTHLDANAVAPETDEGADLVSR